METSDLQAVCEELRRLGGADVVKRDDEVCIAYGLVNKKSPGRFSSSLLPCLFLYSLHRRNDIFAVSIIGFFSRCEQPNVSHVLYSLPWPC
jgi:hypothetical protein